MQWLQALPSPVDIVCLQEVHCTSAEECTRWFSSTGLSRVVSSALCTPVVVSSCIALACPLLVHGQMLMVGLYGASSLFPG